MATLDSILNFLIPVIVVIFGGFLMFRPLRKPLGDFWRWISGIIRGFKNRGQDDSRIVRTLEYE